MKMVRIKDLVQTREDDRGHPIAEGLGTVGQEVETRVKVINPHRNDEIDHIHRGIVHPMGGMSGGILRMVVIIIVPGVVPFTAPHLAIQGNVHRPIVV